MAHVVLVHGIGQEQLSADSLEKDWIPALAGGIRNAGYGAVADGIWRSETAGRRIRMAFYGDLFLKPDVQGEATPSEGDEELSEELAEIWLERAARRGMEDSERRIAERELADLRGMHGERQGARRLGRNTVRRISKLRWFAPYGMAFAQRFVNKALAQVTNYFADEGIRAAALERALGLIGADTQILIGHSLGSIVAYEAAHLTGQTIPLMLSLGSPLGLDTVVYPRLRPQPPAFPARVLRWVNLADPNDFVAGEPDLTNFFSSGVPEGASFEGLRTVQNGAKAHSAEFYLNQKEVGRLLAGVLEG